MGVAESFARPKAIPDTLKASFKVILEEKVPVFSIGLGNPPTDWLKECHKNGTKIIAMISTVEDAKILAEKEVDVIIAQGSEAGGHRSTWEKKESRDVASIGTFALVPQVADAVKQPVVAAGGITDGRGLIAALALGAEGILIGTRFLASKESLISASYKSALLNTSNDKTIVTDVWTGAYARVIQNAFTKAYQESKTPVFPPFVHAGETHGFRTVAEEKGNTELYALYAGQGIGSFHNVPSADEVAVSVMKEAEEILVNLSRKDRA